MFFNAKNDFCKKNFANIFAMSSPLGTGFKSRYLAKSEFLQNFFLYIAKIVFFNHTLSGHAA
jgi:hypothetical protein